MVDYSSCRDGHVFTLIGLHKPNEQLDWGIFDANYSADSIQSSAAAEIVATLSESNKALYRSARLLVGAIGFAVNKLGEHGDGQLLLLLLLRLLPLLLSCCSCRADCCWGDHAGI